MRAGYWILVGVLALWASAVASAQPFERDSRDRQQPTAQTQIPITMPGDPEVMDTESSDTPPPTSLPVPPRVSLEHPIDPNTYICGPGDAFELDFWGKQNFRMRIAADLEGRAFISKVGFVQVAGKTLTEVRAQITKKVRANYPGLQFELTLLSPRTFLVHLVDYVAKPGSYTAQPTQRVSSVLEKAGGITKATGSRRTITIRRKNNVTVTADLVLYELTGDTKHNPFVLDGDVIQVPPAEVVVGIAGAIRRPGSYELVGTADLAELLQLAGGITSSAAKSLPIKIVRRNERQQASSEDLPYTTSGSAPNAPLNDGDSVLVRGSDELQRSVLLIGAVTGADALDAAATSKRLSFVEGDTVLSIIDRAGGIRAPGDLARSYVSRPDKNGTQVVIPIDLDALIVRRDFRADRRIMMGDTIVVPPMRHSILVEGAVTRAGLYTYNPRFGIAEYIAHAGGRTRTARDLSEVKLVEPTGATRSYAAGLKLSPGDTILVPERNFSRAEVVQIVIAVTGLVLSGVAITIAATR